MPRPRRQAQPAQSSTPAQPESVQTDIEDAIKAAQPTTAQLLEEYMKLRTWKDQQTKAFNEFMKPHTDRMEQINGQLLQMALDQGVNGFSTDEATSFISQGIKHKVDPNAAPWVNPETGKVETGREALLDWMLANWDQYGAEHAMINISVEGVKAYIEATKTPEHPEGELPPGISIERWRSFNIRKK